MTGTLTPPSGPAPTSTVPSGTPTAVERVAASRIRRGRRRRLVIALLATLVVVLLAVTLMVGRTFYAPADVVGVILGQDVPGASFTVGRLRLPRAVLAALAGICFGLGGVTFQTMLRNPLASPDIIGISSGASAAAAFAIVLLGLGGAQVSVFAVAAGLGVAVLIYVLSYRGGVAGTRLILIGIGVAAMLDSVTSYVLSKAPQWELQEAMRWLTGSLNGAAWDDVVPVVIALAVLGPALVGQARNLAASSSGTTPPPPSGCASSAPASSWSWPPSASSRSRPPRPGPSRSSRSSPGRSPPASPGPTARPWSPPPSSGRCSSWWPTSPASSRSAPATPWAS